MKQKLTNFVALFSLFAPLAPSPSFAEGHGPTFALATPTLGQGDWSSDSSVMTLSNTDGTSFMFGQMFGYGITEDWGVDLAVASPMLDRTDPMPRTRPGSNRRNGDRVSDSGGEGILIGPTVLGLYGRWGVSGGVLFPAHERLNGSQPGENFRARAIVTYWF